MSTSSPPRSLPVPPYYAVIFVFQRTDGDRGYADVAERMVALASNQPGYLGVESVRDGEGRGITVSYWSSEEAIRRWKAQAEHLQAQAAGKSTWYADYSVQIAKVERAYAKKRDDVA